MPTRQRKDGRLPAQLRRMQITRNFLVWPPGSVLVEMGRTKLICSVSLDSRLPPFLRGKGSGWLTAEYAMIPGATAERAPRESTLGRAKGRTQEIQRLIGRCLRAVVNMDLLEEKTLIVDCDVIQADGGTRTAAITGAYVALKDAVRALREEDVFHTDPIIEAVAAVSVGVVDGMPCLDLSYDEDAAASVDMNVVMTASGKFVEIQGTAEREPFSDKEMEQLIALARSGIAELLEIQKAALGEG